MTKLSISDFRELYWHIRVVPVPPENTDHLHRGFCHSDFRVLVILFLLSIRNNDQHANPHGYRTRRRYVAGQLHRRYGEHLSTEGVGVSTDEACVRGTTEVWKAIMAATVTTITVFLPFLFADNYLVKLIGEHIGISIVATLPYRWSWPCCDTDGGKRYFAQDSGRCQFQ